MANYKVGDRITVSFGGRGSQKAVVHKITKAGNLVAEKYNAKAGKWMKPRRIHETNILQRGWK